MTFRAAQSLILQDSADQDQAIHSAYRSIQHWLRLNNCGINPRSRDLDAGSVRLYNFWVLSSMVYYQFGRALSSASPAAGLVSIQRIPKLLNDIEDVVGQRDMKHTRFYVEAMGTVVDRLSNQWQGL